MGRERRGRRVGRKGKGRTRKRSQPCSSLGLRHKHPSSRMLDTSSQPYLSWTDPLRPLPHRQRFHLLRPHHPRPPHPQATLIPSRPRHPRHTGTPVLKLSVQAPTPALSPRSSLRVSSRHFAPTTWRLRLASAVAVNRLGSRGQVDLQPLWDHSERTMRTVVQEEPKNPPKLFWRISFAPIRRVSDDFALRTNKD